LPRRNIATVVAYAIWGNLLARYSAGAVVPFALLIPCVAAVSSSLAFGERFEAMQAGGDGGDAGRCADYGIANWLGEIEQAAAQLVKACARSILTYSKTIGTNIRTKTDAMMLVRGRAIYHQVRGRVVKRIDE